MGIVQQDGTIRTHSEDGKPLSGSDIGAAGGPTATKVIAAAALEGIAPPPVAQAVPPAAPAAAEIDEPAKILYYEGSAAFDKGDYAVAIEKWEESYGLSGKHVLVYNIASALEEQGRHQDAAERLSDFKGGATNLDSADIAKLESRITELRAKAAAAVSPAAGAPIGAVPAPAAAPEPAVAPEPPVLDLPESEVLQAVQTPEQKEKLNDAQKMGALYGSLLGLEIIGQTAAALSPARRYVRKEEKRLEGLAERGELGLTARERAEIRTAYERPAKAMAEEARMRGEASLAATGGTLSAGELARRRKEESQTVQQALSDAATTITQADMQKAQQQLAKLEGIKEYRTQAQQQATDSILQTVGAGAEALGEVWAAEARPEPSKAAVDNLAREYMKERNISYPEALLIAERKLAETMKQQAKTSAATTAGNDFAGLGF